MEQRHTVLVIDDEADVAKSVADLHGGRVDVQSKVDQGTTFTLTFPPP